MKIGIITNLYPPHARGGAENVIVRTVEQLLSMGHDIFVITGQPRSAGPGPTLGTLSIERVYRFFPRNIYFTLDDHKHRWPVRLLWHMIDAFSNDGANVVRRVLTDEKPDVVITHNFKGIGLKIPQAIHETGIPHVHVMHDLQLVIPSGLRMFGQEHEPWFVKPGYAVYRAICRARLGKPTIVLSPSQFLIDEYKKVGYFQNDDVRFIPNPSPKPSGVLRDARRSGPLRLLFIGQLGHHKGLAFLLDAFAKYDGDARLQIVGGGLLRGLVEERSKHDKRIVYLGYTPQEEVLKCIAAVDAVVVPSLCYENSPTVIYEALSAGVPLIASRIGGVGELIQEGKTGFLFTPGNETEFLQAVRSLDAQKEDFAARANDMRESVSPYALNKYAERLVGVLAEAIAKASRS
jgi:glycosyltransferase involved in cell wall biosynthesis